ncbi:MAG: IS1182 family transposase [Chloroflexota bacterium]|nr:IS1182 family transposase [Chloroflexota bacterium]
MSRFVDCGRDQAFLLPPDLRDWIPEDDLAHFVIEAVERVDLGAFKVNRRGSGSAQYHPRMMLALLIYCYANGIFSSRRIERASRRDIGVRFVAANNHPDHDTIASFRRENLGAVAESFLQVLLLAKELKLVKVGVVSVDGSKFAANASKHRSVTYDRAEELIEQLRLEIAALMERAEAADDGAAEDPQALPREIARREALCARLDAARRRLETQAKARAAAERAAWEAKVAARAGRKGRAKGKRAKPPEGTPRGDEQSNLSDPDSRLMRKSKRHEYRQAYNAQAVVDAGGSQLIVGARITNCASDRNELVADIAAISAGLGRPETVLADNGYANGAQVAALEASGIEALVATATEGRRRRHDFRPTGAGTVVKEAKVDWLREMASKLDSEEGRALYRLRRQTVEPVFGVIKAVLGFTRFSLRGLDKVAGEWTLVALAYNCKRLHKLTLSMAS